MVLGEATVLIRATLLEMMMFVRATVLGEATVLKRMCIVVTVLEATVLSEATVLERMCIGVTVLEATVLSGAWYTEVDPESVGDMDSRNRTGTGRCEKSS
jgi:hypothetical protein